MQTQRELEIEELKIHSLEEFKKTIDSYAVCKPLSKEEREELAEYLYININHVPFEESKPKIRYAMDNLLDLDKEGTNLENEEVVVKKFLKYAFEPQH